MPPHMQITYSVDFCLFLASLVNGFFLRDADFIYYVVNCFESLDEGLGLVLSYSKKLEMVH
jgi:hypothetical protein